MIWEFLDNFIG